MGIELKRYDPRSSEAAQMQLLLNSHKIDLVLDVGANVGQFGAFLRDIGYSGKIVSFEPLSSAYSKLKKLSKKDLLWEVAPRNAIGNIDGEIQINVSKNSQSSSVLKMLDSHLKAAPDAVYVDKEVVKLSKLDTVARDYIETDTCSIFLKIDVQGFETQVLEGASQILPKIKGIQIELSLVLLYEGQLLFRQIIDKMEHLGYELYAVIPNFVDPQTGRLLQLDGVFFKK